MSTLTEIEAAVETLPPGQKKELLVFLAQQLGHKARPRTRSRRGLKAAKRPAIEGLPANLSSGTRERVRALLAERHAAHR